MKADDIVASGTVPSEWAVAANEMTTHIQGAFDELNALGDNPQVPATRFDRDDDGTVLTDDFTDDAGNIISSTPRIVSLADEQGAAVMELHPLAQRARDHGLHAYRYEEAGDGSIVALYVNDAEGKVKMKAFPNIEEASVWSPRDERVTA